MVVDFYLLRWTPDHRSSVGSVGFPFSRRRSPLYFCKWYLQRNAWPDNRANRRTRTSRIKQLSMAISGEVLSLLHRSLLLWLLEQAKGGSSPSTSAGRRLSSNAFVNRSRTHSGSDFFPNRGPSSLSQPHSELTDLRSCKLSSATSETSLGRCLIARSFKNGAHSS